jgi:hypothetical protein
MKHELMANNAMTTTLQRSGWYDSGFKTDSEGVQYIVMHYVGPVEYDSDGNLIKIEGAWIHKEGENVGECVVHYHN